MLVTFHTKVWSSITMFGDVAIMMLKMAGHSGTVPSAFAAEDVPTALTRLKSALSDASSGQQVTRAPWPDDEEPEETALSKALRMGTNHPLVQLLDAAAKANCEVIWNEGAAPL